MRRNPQNIPPNSGKKKSTQLNTAQPEIVWQTLDMVLIDKISSKLCRFWLNGSDTLYINKVDIGNIGSIFWDSFAEAIKDHKYIKEVVPSKDLAKEHAQRIMAARKKSLNRKNMKSEMTHIQNSGMTFYQPINSGHRIRTSGICHNTSTNRTFGSTQIHVYGNNPNFYLTGTNHQGLKNNSSSTEMITLQNQIKGETSTTGCPEDNKYPLTLNKKPNSSKRKRPSLNLNSTDTESKKVEKKQKRSAPEPTTPTQGANSPGIISNDSIFSFTQGSVPQNINEITELFDEQPSKKFPRTCFFLSDSSFPNNPENHQRNQLIKLQRLLLEALANSINKASAALNRCNDDEDTDRDLENYASDYDLEADIEELTRLSNKIKSFDPDQLAKFLTDKTVGSDVIVENPTIFLEVLNILNTLKDSNSFDDRIDEINNEICNCKSQNTF